MHLIRVLFLAGVCAASTVFAYPEMVRHGYVNCTSCHMSPTGGGMLNAYGRVQAEEILSTWSKEGRGSFLHGLLPGETGEEIFSFGGQFRVTQTWTQNASGRRGRFIWMQQDLEASAKFGPFQLVATAGLQDAGNPFLSRRHYLIYRPGPESKWSFRAGRFLPAFGIHVADHAIATKGLIGLGQGVESYNLEAAWIGEQYDVFATANFGRPGEDREKGYTVRAGRALGDRMKVGLSHYYGQDSTRTRILAGGYGILGFSEHFFVLAELDFQSLTTTSATFGPAWYVRADYEFLKGLHFYLSNELSQTDPARPLSYALGAGLQFFPMPHFEFRLHYDKRQDFYTGYVPTDYGWLMAHYYL